MACGASPGWANLFRSVSQPEPSARGLRFAPFRIYLDRIDSRLLLRHGRIHARLGGCLPAACRRMTTMGSTTIVPGRKKRARAASAEFPKVIEVLRSLQKRNKTKPRLPKRGDRIGFSFSTKDRYLFTEQSRQNLDS